MLEQEMEEQLNEQINAELYSAYLYQAMGAYFESKDLEGFAAWMDLQAQEEEAHARKIYDYINQRGGRVKLKAIDAPPVEWDNPLAAFEAALGHEQKVTGMINDLVDLADKKRDRATYSFLQWFVDEQVEEEDSVNAIVEKLKMVEGSSSGLMMLDENLGQRTPAAETEEAQ
ncbi:MAG: ferritin [Halanaerobiales bacterium]